MKEIHSYKKYQLGYLAEVQKGSLKNLKIFVLGACAGVNLAQNKFRNLFLISRIYFIYLVNVDSAKI